MQYSEKQWKILENIEILIKLVTTDKKRSKLVS